MYNALTNRLSSMQYLSNTAMHALCTALQILSLQTLMLLPLYLFQDSSVLIAAVLLYALHLLLLLLLLLLLGKLR